MIFSSKPSSLMMTVLMVLSMSSLITAFVHTHSTSNPFHVRLPTSPIRSSTCRTSLHASSAPYANPSHEQEKEHSNPNDEEILNRKGIYRNRSFGNIITSARRLLQREEVGHKELDSSVAMPPSLVPSDGSRIKKSENSIPNLKMIKTLEEYKITVGQEKDKIVVVRFYATWCKACKAVAPYFRRLAMQNPDIQFVNVPVSAENVNLHQGLGVPSLPYGHIYHPDAGMMEEMKISRKHFGKFARTLKTYAEGQCDVYDEVLSNPELP